MVAYTIKVEADLTGTTAVGAARTWTDMTAKVLSTGMGTPIEIENWRPDQWADVSPSSLDLVIDNSTGTYKPGATGIKPLSSYWRVSATISGVQTFLFDGVLTSAVQGYVGGVKPVTTIKCVDILALFGSRTPLRSVALEEMLLDAPTALYPLDEAESATSAGDLTGANPPAVVTNSKYGAGTLTFGIETSLVGSTTGAAFTTPDYDSASIAARGTYLQGASGIIPSTTAWSLEFWMVGPATIPTNNIILVMQRGSAGNSPGYTFALEIRGTGGEITSILWGAGGGSPAVTIGGASVCDGRLHHIVFTHDADDKTDKIYVDGVLSNTHVAAATVGWANSGGLVTIGFATYGGTYANAFQGTLANFATYPAALSPTRALAHYTAGIKAFCGESTDTHIARLLSYRANFGSSLDAGVGAVGVQDTTGVSLAEALLATARAEVGVVYINGSAQVAFRNRSRLFNPATALTLSATNTGEVTPDVEPRIDDQGVVNDATISRPRGADQRAFDAASIALYGTNDGSGDRIVNSDQAALDIANDLVAQNKTPLVDTQTITCDVNAMSTVATAQSVLARAPLDRVTVTNLPSTSPAIDGIVQGRHITIGADKTFTVTFSLSPLRLPVMVADDATLGICDTVNVAAF